MKNREVSNDSLDPKEQIEDSRLLTVALYFYVQALLVVGLWVMSQISCLHPAFCKGPSGGV
eukprot:2520146-Amphidinium_carterae.1